EEAPAEELKAEETPAEETPDNDGVIASPAVRKLARENNIDLTKVQAQDPLGRVRPVDAEAADEAAKSAAGSSPHAASATQPDFSKPVRIEKMSRRRQTIAKRLVEAQHESAMLTTFNEIDMTAIMNLRKERQDAFVKKNDIKLGFMSFFTKASVA